ncbi:MAG: mucoidy inhibitor MuiA family protein, partial [Bacteroidetes bacterium]
ARLAAGRGTLILTKLSAQVDEGSVRFGATGAFTILSINPRRNYLAPPDASPEVATLEAERQEVQDAIHRRELRMSALKAEEQVILDQQKLGRDEHGISPAELEALAQYVGERLAQLRLAYFEHERSLRKERERLTQLQRQIAELGQEKGKNITEVVVQYQADQAVDAEFQLSYLVPQAQWRPIYDLRVSDLSEPVRLTYGALLSQTTGENWTDVQLTLSTGNPREQQNAPRITTWWLSPYQPMAVAAQSRQPADLDGMLSNVIITQGERDRADFAGAEVSVNLTNTEFAVRLPQDIPSDGQEYRVAMEDYQLPADYQYYAAPRLDAHVYLTARLTDWQQYSLLSGPVNLFFDGAYVGRSELRTQSAVDTLVFSLGRDEGLSITRTKDDNYRSRRFLGSKIVQSRGWTITVKKNRRNQVPIIIEDQIPVSTSDAIEVELTGYDKAHYNETTGILRWELDLKMGEQQSVSFRYQVEHPKNMPISLE